MMIGDGTLVLQYDPETKEKSQMEEFRVLMTEENTNFRIMLICCSQVSGVVHYKSVLKEKPSTKCSVL